MDFQAALSDLATGAGRSIIVGQELEQQRAQTQAIQTHTAAQQMQILMQREELRSRETTAADLRATMQQQGGAIKTQGDIAKAATAAEAHALARGDFNGAARMSELATKAGAQEKEQTLQMTREQQTKLEATGNAASQFLNNPSKETALDLVSSAIRSGANLNTVPLVGDPKFSDWARTQETSGMNTKQRLEFAQKAKDQDARRKEDERYHRELAESRRQRQAELAVMREGNLEFRKLLLESKRDSGLKLTAIQRGILDTTAKMSHEGARSLVSLTKFPLDAAGTAFGDLRSHDVMASIARAGANVMTPQMAQQLSVASAGLGRSVLLMETLGQGSRAPSEAQIEAMQRTVTPAPGDTPLTAMYKLSTAAAVMKTGLEVRNEHPNARIEAALKGDEKFFAGFPSPEEVLEISMRDPLAKQQIEAWQATGSFGNALDTIKAQLGAPGTAAVQPAPPAAGLPAGWK